MAFVRKGEATIVTLVLVILLGISWWVALAYFKALTETRLFQSETLFRPTGASAMVGNVDTSSWSAYQNATAGFGLRYPYDWYVNEVSADPATHGDVVSGGSVITPFEADVTSATGFGITARHVFPNYDGQSVNAQWQNIINAIQPLAGNYNELSSKNGARYMRSFTDSAASNGSLIAYVPTGKYTIEVQAVDAGNANDVQIFDAILQTIALR